MGASFRILTLRGIDIRLHFTFPLILIWGAFQFGWLTGQGLGGALFGVVVTLILFSIVVLHELGHSFAAQYYGVPVKQIVLLPIGGVAQLERMPEKPREELVIAIAGPAVNFVLAILMILIALVFRQAGWLTNPLEIFGGLNLGAGDGWARIQAVFGYIFAANLFLAIFNLLPAFPMDGGRVLRATLAIWLPYVKATRIAVNIGQLMAWGLGLWGFLGGGFFLILIAVFIYTGAGAEGRMVELRERFQGMTVAKAYTREVQVLSPSQTLHDAVELTLRSFQADFPVCDGGKLVGMLTHQRIIEMLDQSGRDTLVGETMVVVAPVSPEEDIMDVQQRFATEGIEVLPVVEQGFAGPDRFLGLITNRDLNELYRLAAAVPGLQFPPSRTAPKNQA